MSAALKDIQLHCSEDTYELMRQTIIANRMKESIGLEKMTAKLIEERD